MSAKVGSLYNLNRGESLGSGSDMMSNNISLEPPSLVLSGESRYLAPLWTFAKYDELSHSAATDGFELEVGDTDVYNHKVGDKIKAALKLLSFRKQHVLVQYWLPQVFGRDQYLVTKDQPFGFGVNDENLLLYRKESEKNSVVVHNDDDEEEDVSPLARVYKRGLPEWTPDLTNYLPKYFPQQACAIRCNLHGYVAIPVFDSSKQLCVGVLEILTSSIYPDFAYEIQQVYDALKSQDLTCLQVCDDHTSNVPREPGENQLDKIFSILKIACDTYNLPLAQTWALSPLCTFASHEQTLTKSCSSFDSKCFGKLCMSTVSLPYYVRDLRLWPFRKACTGLHLDAYCGLVGRALQSRGSAFCGDVTKLSKEEYPLVHNAHKSRLTSCLAIFLHSIETNDDFVLEFFHQSPLKDGTHVLNLVQMLKHNIEIASGFELGVNIEPDVIETSSHTMDTLTDVEDMYIMDSLTDVEDTAETDSVVSAAHKCCSPYSSITITKNAGEWSSPLRKGTKRQRGSKITKHPRSSKVTITYEEDIIRFRFHISLGLLELENLVAKRFKLENQRIRLKYKDIENDWILICDDNDLHLALVASGRANCISLTCETINH